MQLLLADEQRFEDWDQRDLFILLEVEKETMGLFSCYLGMTHRD